MVITLLESYFLWSELTDNRNISNSESNNDPLYLEKGFYLSTLQIVLCKECTKLKSSEFILLN